MIKRKSEASSGSSRHVSAPPTMLRPERLVRQFFLGFVRIHILHHAAIEPVTGVELSEELRRHGYCLSPGTLYPILHALTTSGYLRCRPTVHNGRLRKPYVITAAGREALVCARKQITELVEEVMERDRA